MGLENVNVIAIIINDSELKLTCYDSKSNFIEEKKKKCKTLVVIIFI